MDKISTHHTQTADQSAVNSFTSSHVVSGTNYKLNVCLGDQCGEYAVFMNSWTIMVELTLFTLCKSAPRLCTWAGA